LNTELSAARGSVLQVRVAIIANLLGPPKVLLNVLSVHDGLLFCAVTNSDDAIALGTVLMSSP
jgi:hypothetical protein